jgi:hypothetical protein
MQGGWLVPLNIHHSLALRTVARNSRQLQNISSSLVNLTNSVIAIQQSSIELTGTANAILDLLKSEKHRVETIAAMRSLIFNHLNTCESAVKEDDNLTAYSSCIVSERLLNQPWFNTELFSYASFDEMKSASTDLNRSQEIMDEIESRLDQEERSMISIFVGSLDKLEQMENERIVSTNNFVSKLKKPSWGVMWKIDSDGILFQFKAWHGPLKGREWRIFKSSQNIYHAVALNRLPRGEEPEASELWAAQKSFMFSDDWEDVTVDDWEKVLNILSNDLPIIEDKYVPQELIELSLRPLREPTFWDSTEWKTGHRETCLTAIDRIDGICDAYDNWKSVFDHNDGERKLLIDNANESFKGRLGIEVSNGV